MPGSPAPWERRLADLALAGLNRNEPQPDVRADAEQIQAAFARCEAITAEHSKTFHFASGLMPPGKRQAARALYAFCRVTDDIVDRAAGDAAALAAWRERAMGLDPPQDDPVCLAWAHTRAAYRIPARYGDQLIAGVARDLVKTRYQTFLELAEYCYGVASTVGLMSMHIIGYRRPEAVPYAIKMGVALQLTNILRDVGEDWRNGRLYLPQEELERFGLAEAEVKVGQVDGRWRAFMRFQIERNRRLYAEAWPGIALLHPHGRFAVAAAADLYSAILSDIEAHDFDVFRRRAYVSKAGKLGKLPGIWWKVRRLPGLTTESGRSESATDASKEQP